MYKILYLPLGKYLNRKSRYFGCDSMLENYNTLKEWAEEKGMVYLWFEGESNNNLLHLEKYDINEFELIEEEEGDRNGLQE